MDELKSQSSDDAVDVHAWVVTRKTHKDRLYALVDRSEPDPDLAWLREFDRCVTNLFSRLRLQPQALPTAPVLVAMDQGFVEVQMMNAYASQSAESCTVSLIASPLDAGGVAQRLVRRMELESEGTAYLLRWWDPRVMLALSEAWSGDLRHDVLAFGTQMLLPNRRGGHLALALHCPEDDPLAERPLVCTGEQLDALVETTAPDAVLGLLREQDAALLDSLPDAQRHAWACAQIKRCCERGFFAARDHALALALAIQHGADWWGAPAWRPCVAKAEDKHSLVEAYLAMTHEESA